MVHNCNHTCKHQHSIIDKEDSLGEKESLYWLIDKDKLECYNEHQTGAGKSIFKPFDERFDVSNVSNLRYFSSSSSFS